MIKTSLYPMYAGGRLDIDYEFHLNNALSHVRRGKARILLYLRY